MDSRGYIVYLVEWRTTFLGRYFIDIVVIMIFSNKKKDKLVLHKLLIYFLF